MSGIDRGISPESAERSLESTRTFASSSQLPELSFEIAHAGVLQEMALDWEGGARTLAEEWFERYPHLAADAETAVRIVYEEVCLREEHGEPVDAAEVLRRFPQWTDELKMLLDCHQLIQSEQPAPSFPQAGQQFGELQLVRKLGSGALGQVFLATQSSLSDRPLVVKLTPRTGDEHLSLARLQHTHIVPLYHVLDLPEQGLRALCMPYVGGQSWSTLLAKLKATPAVERTGGTLVERLIEGADQSPSAPQRTGPALAFLSRASYVQSVCWIGACLADALHYAHQCGLVHLDIKPSNILVAGDGQPMLLDFHLARPVISANSPPPRRLGGTRGYMSPEQDLATAAVREGRAIPKAVDGRSDVYSLGVTLYESLVGRAPPADDAARRRQFRQAVTHGSRGLEDIVHKCLAPNARERYATAGQLADDLRRHLADLPLQGVPNRSVRERWRKWRRRKPHALAGIAAVLAVVGLSAAFVLLYGSDRVGTARAALVQAEQSAAQNEFATAVDQLETGVRAVRWLPGLRSLKQDLNVRLAEARHGRRAQAVHRLAEELRFLDSYQSVPLAQLEELEEGCRALWAVREQLVKHPGQHTTDPAEQELKADLTDIAVASSALELRLRPEDLESARRGARRRLAEAEALCGPSFTLDLARRLLELPGGEAAAVDLGELPVPRSPHDHYELGRFLFAQARMRDAMREFDRAIVLEPGAFWPYFYQSIAAFRVGEYDRSLNAANVCIALVPDSAACYYNRALCYQSLEDPPRALDDLNRAIKLDPELPAAWLQRGVLMAQQGDYSAARSDLTKALELGANAAETHFELARAAIATGNREAARRHLSIALNSDASFAPAATLLAELDAHGE